MAHNTREFSDEEWVLARTVPAAKIRNIDEKTRKAVSESGGAWDPSSPIIITGAGIELQSGGEFQGTAKTKPAPGSNYRFGDNDYFSFLVVDRNLSHLAQDFFPTPATVPTDCRVTGALSGEHAVLTRRAGAVLRIPVRTINGARFVRVDVVFSVGSSHTDVPAQLSRARLVRVDETGEITPFPSVTTSTNIVRGERWVSPSRPATGADWYSSGDLQTIRIDFDGDDGELIDRATYDYAVEWQEETGLNAFVNEAGNYIYGIIATYRSTTHRPV